MLFLILQELQREPLACGVLARQYIPLNRCVRAL